MALDTDEHGPMFIVSDSTGSFQTAILPSFMFLDCDASREFTVEYAE